MIWILLWLAIALAVFGAFILSSGVDLKQARAWKVFAGKTGLTFVQKGFLQPPAVIGSLNGYEIRLYTMVEDNKETRRRMVRTFAEIDLKTGLDAPFVISQQVYPGLFESMTGTHATLDGIYAKINICENPSEVAQFFSGQKLATLQEFWRLKDYSPIVLNTASALSLAVCTGEALSHPREIQSLFKSLIEIARKIDR